MPDREARDPKPKPTLTRALAEQIRAGARWAEARAEARKRPITRVLPVARIVALGGRPFALIELQLRDLAELQAWLEDDAGHPLDGIPPEALDPDPAGRPARLARAYRAAESWPPRLGSEEAGRRLGSPAGRAFFLMVALRKCQPRFGADDALALLPEITPEEWRRLRRVAWGWTPREEILAELDPAQEPGPLPDWAEEADALQELRGVSYRDLGDLTLSQWRNIRAAGTRDRHRAHRRPGETQAAADERLRRSLVVPDPDPAREPDAD